MTKVPRMRTATGLRLAVALTLVPLAVSALALRVGHGTYAPIGDLATTELVTRDVGRYAVEIGPYSRDGWHHPGPALFYLLALPYRLLGSVSSGMDVGALLINGASVAGMAFVARRRGGAALMLVTLLGCALLMRSLGPDEVRLPWNPYVTVLPYGLLVFLTWALTCRDRWALPVAVFVASFVAQTHIGYVALALPLVAYGAGWLVVSTAVQARRDRSAPGLRTLVAPVSAAAAIALLMWLPPVVQQLTGDRGNLGAALEWFRHGGVEREAPRGFLTGWRVVSAQFGLPPEWLFGERGIGFTSEPVYVYEPMVPVLLLVVVGAGYVLWRRRPAGAGRLVGVWLLATVVGIVATARTIGLVYEYRVGWARALGMVAGVIVGWAGWSAVTSWRPQLERRVLMPLTLVALAVLAVLAVVGSVAHVAAGRPQPEESERVEAVVAPVVDGLPPGEGPVLVDGSSTFESAIYGPALLLQLERRGIDARMVEGDTAAGEHRMDEGGPRLAHLVVATAEAIPELAADPGATLLAYDGDLSMDDLRDQAAAQAPVPGGTTLAVFLVAAPVEPPEEP
jgi:hypothetical protein